MKTHSSFRRRLARFLLAVITLPLLLTGCAERLPKVGEAQKIGVTLPFKAEAGGVKLKVSVGTVKDPIKPEMNKTRSVDVNSLESSKYTIVAQPLVIPEGEISGEIKLTITDSSYAGQHFLIFFDETGGTHPGRLPYLGVTSLTLAPDSAPPVRAGRYHIRTTSSTWIGPKRR